jgi:hypothetical protein
MMYLMLRSCYILILPTRVAPEAGSDGMSRYGDDSATLEILGVGDTAGSAVVVVRNQTSPRRPIDNEHLLG